MSSISPQPFCVYNLQGELICDQIETYIDNNDYYDYYEGYVDNNQYYGYNIEPYTQGIEEFYAPSPSIAPPKIVPAPTSVARLPPSPSIAPPTSVARPSPSPSIAPLKLPLLPPSLFNTKNNSKSKSVNMPPTNKVFKSAGKPQKSNQSAKKFDISRADKTAAATNNQNTFKTFLSKNKAKYDFSKSGSKKGREHFYAGLPSKIDCEFKTEDWGPCIPNNPENCNGVKYRYVRVIKPNSHGGKSCPTLVESQRCDVDSAKCKHCVSSSDDYMKRYAIKGKFKTGWEHYEKVGRGEGRMYKMCG